LGHVVNAIYVWGIARAIGGSVLLRIEDHDRIRSRVTFERGLLEDLDWLGFVPDTGRRPPLRQSDRPDRYEGALLRLRRFHSVYACDCSRKVIGSECYRNTCRGRALEERPGRGLRVEMTAGAERFVDGLTGAEYEMAAEDSGDLLLRDRDGHWTYQFAVTVDDDEDHINLVIRGADLLSSTGRQIRLGRMLGRTAPARFLHHPLVLAPSGQKLSKANRDVGVKDLRAAGLSAADVIGRAAAAIGLQDSAYPVHATDVVRLFG
jgi:glutamyl-tRNA synthetase/glutamyl-Q tRNA(Asp) synthetase